MNHQLDPKIETKFDPISYFESVSDERYSPKVEKNLSRKVNLLEKERDRKITDLKWQIDALTNYDTEKIMSDDWNENLFLDELEIKESQDPRIVEILKNISDIRNDENYDSLFRQAVDDYLSQKDFRKKTINTLVKSTLLIPAALLTFGAVKGIGALSNNVRLNRNAQEVTSLIENYELRTAEDLFSQYVEAEELKPVDIAKIRALFREYGDGLDVLENIKTGNIEQRISFCENYLENNPEGSFVEEAAERLIIDNFSLLEQEIELSSYNGAYSQLLEINYLLDQDSTNMSGFVEQIDVVRVLDNIENSIPELYKFGDSREYDVGRDVVVADSVSGHWMSNYLNERESVAPRGSTGTITKHNSIGYITISIDEPKDEWVTAWSNLTNSEGEIFADYVANELLIKTTETERELFQTELDKTRNLIEY